MHGRRRLLTWSHDFRVSWLKTNSGFARRRGANSQTSGSGRPCRADLGGKARLCAFWP